MACAALENAVSVASVVVTTESLGAEPPPEPRPGR